MKVHLNMEQKKKITVPIEVFTSLKESPFFLLLQSTHDQQNMFFLTIK